jgi:hypothetical protein
VRAEELADVRSAALAQYGALDGKAMADMDRATERRFCSFLEALGGRPADGCGTLGAEALLCEEADFERGGALWYGEVEPETDAERDALERWRGESP